MWPILYSEEDPAKSVSSDHNISGYSESSGSEPHWISQEDQNDFLHDLYLSKQQSALLASQMK